MYEDSTSLITAIEPPESNKILSLKLMQLEAYMAQRTFELVAEAK